jgi:C_GCAxxG_C_C family probable redox protein
MARTCGTCGAVTGAILGLNVAFGRSDATESVEENYGVIQDFIEQFRKTHGSTNCARLLGCDLGSQEGQRIFQEDNLRRKCRKFTGDAAEIAITIIEAKRQP